MTSDPFDTLSQIAAAVPVGQWMLVGGVMTRMIQAIADQPDAWQVCPPDDWPKAIRSARAIDPSWAAPEFIRQRRPGRASR